MRFLTLFLAALFSNYLAADLVWITDTLQSTVWCYNEYNAQGIANPRSISSSEYGLPGVQPYCVGANLESVCIGSGSSLNPYVTLLKTQLDHGEVKIAPINSAQLQSSLSSASEINQLVYNPNDQYWWAVVDSFLGTDGRVCLYNPKTYEFTLYSNPMIPNTDALTGVAFAANYAYITDFTTSNVIALTTSNLNQPALIGTLVPPGGSGPLNPIALAYSSAGNRLCVLNQLSSVTIFNARSAVDFTIDTVTLDSGATLGGIALSPDGRYGYISDTTNSRIYILDIVAGISLGFIDSSLGVPSNPTALAASTGFLYVLSGSSVSSFERVEASLTLVSSNVFPFAAASSIAAQIFPICVKQRPGI